MFPKAAASNFLFGMTCLQFSVWRSHPPGPGSCSLSDELCHLMASFLMGLSLPLGSLYQILLNFQQWGDPSMLPPLATSMRSAFPWGGNPGFLPGHAVIPTTYLLQKPLIVALIKLSYTHNTCVCAHARADFCSLQQKLLSLWDIDCTIPSFHWYLGRVEVDIHARVSPLLGIPSGLPDWLHAHSPQPPAHPALSWK